MSKRKTDLVRANLAESRRLRKEMSVAGDEFVSSLRRIANRDGGWKVRSATSGRYLHRNSNGGTIKGSTTGAIGSKPDSRVQAP